MKVWVGYGTEHSANLKMIGTFKDIASAEEAQECLDRLVEYVGSAKEELSGADSYSDELMALLREINLYVLPPEEFEQFRYDVSYERKDNQILFSTDETQISAFLQVLIHKGARVEVFSEHDYPASSGE